MIIRQSALVRLGLLLLCACAVTVVARAQQEPGMNFVYGYQAFAYSDSTSLFELDYQFAEQGLSYVDKGKGPTGSLYLRFVLLDEKGSKALATDWITATPAPSEKQEPRDLLGVKYFELRPGRYSAELYFEDLGKPEHRDSTTFLLVVRSFAGRKLQLSDIEMISEDVNATTDAANPFYKNGWAVIPSPAGQVVPPFLLLTTYVEIYNAQQIPTSEFNVSYSLADSTGKIFYQQDKQLKRPESATMLDINRIDLTELPSGTYYLLIKAVNGLRVAATDSAVVVKPISVINPEKDAALAEARRRTPAVTDVVDPIYAGKTEAELEEEFQKIRYIAVNAEIDAWKQVSGVDARGRFLTMFWLRRDPTPGTPLNEYREDYFARVEVARVSYRAPMAKKGWDSDRGRILLQYGKPDGIDRHPSDYNRKPYEVWTYSRDNMVFVFVDRAQTGTYALVHSNAKSEPRDENWVANFAILDRTFEVKR